VSGTADRKDQVGEEAKVSPLTGTDPETDVTQPVEAGEPQPAGTGPVESSAGPVEAAADPAEATRT